MKSYGIREKGVIPTDIILILTLTIVFILMGIVKEPSHCDEIYSYESANSDMPAVAEYNVMYTDEWITGEQVNEWLSATKLSPWLYKQISVQLYKDHVPLYFWIFRTVSVLLFSGSGTKWIGLICNYPFFIGLGILLQHFLAKRFKPSVAFWGTLFVMLHPIMITQVTMLRMYQMYTCIMIAFMLLMSEKQLEKLWYRILMGVLLAAGLLTHYHFWLFGIAFSGCYLLALLIRKKYKTAFSYMQVGIIGLLLTTLLYPSWRVFLFAGNGATSLNNLFSIGNLLTNVKAGFQMLVSVVFGEYAVIGGIITLGGLIWFLIADRLKTVKFYVIAGTVILQTCVISQAGLLQERYYWPIAGTLLVGIVYIMCRAGKYLLTVYIEKPKQRLIMNSVCIALFAGLILTDVIAWSKPDSIRYFRSRSKDATERILEVSDIPWLIFADDIGSLHWGFMDFTYADMLRRIPTTASPYFDEKIESSDKAVVFTMDALKSIEDCIEYLEGSSNHDYTDYQKIATSGGYSVYVIE